MDDADVSELSAIEDTLMDPAVVERAVEHAITALEEHRSADQREKLEKDLTAAEKAILA